ncbi:3'-5' exonuclease [Grosmannia clavigera kw1407]|uniref:3'-5' exonuclease n=1 Tax=Grosmannia clavigera (strain kw1407 / UAMH 11150) TaxID=655863 RepID=F0XEX2_GROCL|nr:3'-5' exonuclease [Grosmannia clavigera kw1407]EFX04585.1 3'-5' exonuclease [Grosmannia clavigera kw1407]
MALFIVPNRMYKDVPQTFSRVITFAHVSLARVKAPLRLDSSYHRRLINSFAHPILAATPSRRYIGTKALFSASPPPNVANKTCAKGDARHETGAGASPRALASIRLDSELSASGLVDTPAAVAAFVDMLYALPTTPPSLYIDVEGVNLSRVGTVSIIQVFVLPKSRAYLLDVHTLKDKAFSTPGTRGRTFQDLLESAAIPKVIFDVRNDSDALFGRFRIRLAGIQDLQLMELATRSYDKGRVKGLAKCIEKDAQLSPADKADWKATKEKGVRLFLPGQGRRRHAFNERPLSEDVRRYCIQDVQFLPQLWEYYNSRLTRAWRKRVRRASGERVTLSQARCT